MGKEGWYLVHFSTMGTACFARGRNHDEAVEVGRAIVRKPKGDAFSIPIGRRHEPPEWSKGVLLKWIGPHFLRAPTGKTLYAISESGKGTLFSHPTISIYIVEGGVLRGYDSSDRAYGNLFGWLR